MILDVAHKKDTLANNMKNDINQHRFKEIKRIDHVASQNTHVALVLLEKILLLNGSLLSCDNVNTIVSNVCNACVNVYRKMGCVAPYSKVGNRVRLLEVVKRLLNLHTGSVRIPMSIILSHFTDGLTDVDDSVRGLCRNTLVEYDSVLHPMDLGFYDNKPDVVQHDFVFSRESSVLPNTTPSGITSSVSGASSTKPQSCGSADHFSTSSKETTMVAEAPRRSSAEAVSSSHTLGRGSISQSPSKGIAHPNKNLPSSSHPEGVIRQCGSADEILATKNTNPIPPVTRRSISEPQVFHSAPTSVQRNLPTLSKSPNNLSTKTSNLPGSNMNIVNNNNNNNTNNNVGTNNTFFNNGMTNFNNNTNKPSNMGGVSLNKTNNVMMVSKLPPAHLNVHKNNSNINVTTAIHIDDESPSPDKECVAPQQDYDNHGSGTFVENQENFKDDAVVISDSSDEDVSCTKSVQKFSSGLSADGDLYSSPRSAKRAKLNTSSGGDLRYCEDDADYILSTFCDNTSADH